MDPVHELNEFAYTNTRRDGTACTLVRLAGSAGERTAAAARRIVVCLPQASHEDDKGRHQRVHKHEREAQPVPPRRFAAPAGAAPGGCRGLSRGGSHRCHWAAAVASRYWTIRHCGSARDPRDKRGRRLLCKSAKQPGGEELVLSTIVDPLSPTTPITHTLANEHEVTSAPPTNTMLRPFKTVLSQGLLAKELAHKMADLETTVKQLGTSEDA